MRTPELTRTQTQTAMPDPAWYLRCRNDQVGDRVILVGDRARVLKIADRLDEVAWLNEDRGLTLATGMYKGRQVTASAFGMGAPIAAVVLHELWALGVHTFLRLGTVLGLPPVRPGHLVLADAALRNEGASGTYVPHGYPAAADHDLAAQLRTRLERSGRRWHAGLVASDDGFYTHLFAFDQVWSDQVERTRSLMEHLGILGMDMETSTVLAVARRLGARAGSLLLATVDARTRTRLEADDRARAEEDLVTVGLETLAALEACPSPQAHRTDGD